MISDPLTLGTSGFDTVFQLIENGPGGRTKRSSGADVAAGSGSPYTVQNQDLTISHSQSGKNRDRSLFRLDVDYILAAALVSGVTDQSNQGSAYLVLDLPSAKAPGGGGREDVAKFLLARLLGFLSENATGAPDFDFSSNENVLKFIAKEP